MSTVQPTTRYVNVDGSRVAYQDFGSGPVVPTLVMHRAGYPVIPSSHGRYLAAHIAGAQYTEIPGVDGAMFWEEPDLILRTLREFVTEDTHESTSHIATILLSDIVRSTERAESLGNRPWSATDA